MSISPEEFDEIKYFVDNPQSAHCKQDVFLDTLCRIINQYYTSTFQKHGYAMYDPHVIYPEIKYNYEGNHRQIYDSKSKVLIDAFFENPLEKSPLFLALRHSKIMPKKQLSNSVCTLTDGYFKSTSSAENEYPFVIGIDMRPNKSRYANYNVKDSLKFMDPGNTLGNAIFQLYDEYKIMDNIDLNQLSGRVDIHNIRNISDRDIKKI